MSQILLDENVVAPATPTAGKSIIYPKSDGLWYSKDDAGVETPFAIVLPVTAAQGGTGVTSYTVGDILYASGVATLSKLAAGANNTFLKSAGVGVAPVYFNLFGTANTFTATQAFAGITATTGVFSSTFKVDYVGPNVIGSASTETFTALLLTGTFTPTSGAFGVRTSYTINVPVGESAYLSAFGGTLVEAASGTHSVFATTRFSPPTITAGAATLTTAATVYITGAPTGGSTNYALFIADGLVLVNGFGTHAFSAGGNGDQQISLVNTTSGTAARGVLVVQAGAILGQIVTFSQGFTTSGTSIAGSTRIYNDGAGGISLVAQDASGAIRFYSGGTTKRGMFDSSGNFIVGNTTSVDPAGDQVAGSVLSADGYISTNRVGNAAGNIGRSSTTGVLFNFIYNGAVKGTISTDGTNTAYNTTSDMRLKRDKGIVSDLSALLSIKIHDFEWIKDGRVARGVFAQEIVNIYPSAVFVGGDKCDKNGNLEIPWQVDYSKFVPDLIVGCQNHESRIAALESRIN